MAKKANNYKDMAKGELDKKLKALREDLRAYEFKAEGAKSRNVREPRGLRKEVARILTQINKPVANK